MHPGGPFWARGRRRVVDPQGRVEDGEEAVACALREFEEELGAPPSAELVDARRRAPEEPQGVRVGGRGRPRRDAVRSNTFTMEWPPRSGRQAEFPEIDRAEWFPLDVAREKLNPAQAEFLDRPPFSQG